MIRRFVLLLVSASMMIRPSVQAQGTDTEVHPQGGQLHTTETWINPWSPSQKGAFRPIQRARIFPIEASHRREAIELLEHQPMLALSPDQQQHFMDGTVLLGDAIVDKVIADADAESKLTGAPSAVQSIAYTRSLSGKLQPYLVHAVAANAGGVFSAEWCGKDLCVLNGSLGKYNFERKQIIIYLEKAPTTVWVHVASAD
jgi:hypothetical protein